MTKTIYLNNTPFQEKDCPSCGKSNQKIKRPDWRDFKFIYLHIYSDDSKAIGMCISPGQVDWRAIELHPADILAEDWQLIEE